jgi:sigma-B regulation protein RsbU (phosphoserine phosphatase)
MERELQIAYRVQASLIPEHPPSVSGWEFAAFWQQTREVSGDFYDFIPCKNDFIGVLISDVTDKGMPAALFMAMTRSILRSSLNQAASPAQGITTTNHLICADSTINMPVTVFHGVIDPQNDQFVYVNASHNPQLLYRNGTDWPVELSCSGMLMGFMGNEFYDQGMLEINPGNFIVFYTDGVTNASNANQVSYGIDRFQGAIVENRHLSTEKILSGIDDSVLKFIDPTAPYDDSTLLIARGL